MSKGISFLSILSLVFFNVAIAEEKIKDKELRIMFGMSLDELAKLEVPAVEIASKTLETRYSAPSSVTVFTAKEIKNMGIKSVQELLNFVPGFQSTRESRLNQGFMMAARGTTTPQSSYNILFMLDKHRLNDESSSGVGAANHYLTTANVKRVEVIRGPGSALYGASAFTGAVNIITKDKAVEDDKKPENEKENEFYFAGGNLDSREFHGLVSKEGDDWSVSLFGRYYEDNGQDYNDSSNATPDVIEHDQEAYLKFKWKNFHLKARYSEEEFRGFLGEREKENLQQESIRLEYKDLTFEDLNLSFYASFQHGHLHSDNLISRTTATIDDAEYNLGFNGRYQINEQHLLLAGMEWRYASVRGNVVPKSKRDVLGAYLQHQYKIMENLKLTLGLRYDGYSDNDETLNPRVALVYISDFDASFKLMYGQAFRAPSIRQTSQSRGLGNPNLKAEKIKTLEFAWLQKYENFLNTSVTYFHNWSENKIDTVFNPNALPGDIQRKFANSSNVIKSSGIEIEAQTSFKNFSLRTSFTHLIDTEQNPRRVAKNTLSLIANYQYQDLNINLNGYYHDKMEQEIGATGFSELDDYLIFNANVRYSVTDWLTLVGQGHNLLNEKYFNSTKLPNLPNGVPNRDRTFSIGVELSF